MKIAVPVVLTSSILMFIGTTLAWLKFKGTGYFLYQRVLHSSEDPCLVKIQRYRLLLYERVLHSSEGDWFFAVLPNCTLSSLEKKCS